MFHEPIHLAFCLFNRDRHSPYPMALAATYSSIRQQTQARLHLHVLVDESVRSLTRRKLRRCLSCGDKLTFRSVDALPEARAIAMRMDSRFSPAIIWRAWLPEFLPDLRRCILLDSDLLVLMDINRIWRLRLGRARLSAFPRGTPHPRAYHDWISTPPERYFRMGVCLMDLAGIRRERAFIQGRRSFLEDALEHQRRRSMPMAGLFEQSLYNRFFSARYKPLPFPLCPANRLDQDPQRYHHLLQRLARHEPLILNIKGWLNQSPISLLFWSSLLHTPWARCAARNIALASPQS